MRPIDADALEEMFKTQYECEACDNYDGVRCRACHCDDALGIIDSAPTLDVQPVRRGEWEICWGGVLCCTVCGKSADDFIGGLEGANYIEEPNFCPNCGADMRGDKE